MNLKPIAEKIIAESSFSRVWHHIDNAKTFAVISAFRGFNESKENLALHQRLKNDVRVLGLGYVEQESGYTYKEPKTGEDSTVEERSLFIPGITFDQAVTLGNKYGQETIIFKDIDQFVLYDPTTKAVVFDFAKEKPLTFDADTIKFAFSKFLRTKNKSAAKQYAFVVKELIVPTRLEAALAIKTARLAEAKWLTIMESS
jgi:hypothetical protein